MSRQAEALAQLERLVATGLLHDLGTRASANEIHEIVGRVIPRAIAAMSWQEREALAEALQRTVNASLAKQMEAAT